MSFIIITIVVILFLQYFIKSMFHFKPKIYRAVPDQVKIGDTLSPRILDCWQSETKQQYLNDTQSQLEQIEELQENMLVEQIVLEKNNIWILDECLETLSLIDSSSVFKNSMLFYKWIPEGQHIQCVHSTQFILNIDPNNDLKILYGKTPKTKSQKNNSTNNVKLSVFKQKPPSKILNSFEELTLAPMQGLALPPGFIIDFPDNKQSSFMFTTGSQLLDIPMIFLKMRFF